jgi:HAD superfamily phosphoserine phosphatase-like hydrolase
MRQILPGGKEPDGQSLRFYGSGSSMKTTLAIYDMDRTITRRPTYGAFMRRAVAGLAPWRIVLAPLVILTTLAYLLRLIDRGRLKEANFRLLIGRVAPERLERLVEDFAARQVRTNIMDGARARLAEDKAAGRRLVLATASYRLYAAAIARRLGFDDVIATDVEYDAHGRTVARIDGVNCYGLGKLDMIEAWLQQQGLERDAVHIRFYSDHISDAPVHHWSDEAFATNAHARLVRLAEDEGWEVLDWRDRRRA